MTISKSELIGRKVYTADAGSVGEVADIGFTVGDNQATLIVKSPDGSMVDLPWDAVGSAKDIVLLKAGADPMKFKRAAQPTAPAQAQPVSGAPTEKRFCPNCGKPLTWIPEYKRWYCYKEKKYV